MIKKTILLLVLAIAFIPTTSASDLANAVSSGKVCERMDGFIQATPGNEAEMAGLVSEINGKRKGVYADIASKEKGESASKEEGLNSAAVGAEMAREQQASNPGIFCK